MLEHLRYLVFVIRALLRKTDEAILAGELTVTVGANVQVSGGSGSLASWEAYLAAAVRAAPGSALASSWSQRGIRRAVHVLSASAACGEADG